MIDRKKLNLKNDIIFKAFFTRKGNEKFLISFLEAILKIKIDEIEAVESSLLQRYQEDKLVRLDIKAKINKKEIVNIEIQLKNENNMEKRSTYYGARLITEQFESGQKYEELKPVILINILNYNLLEVPEYCTKTVTVAEKHREYEIIKDVTYYFIELTKFRKSKPRIASLLDYWLALIDSEDGGNLGMEKDKIEIIEEAKRELEKMLADPEVRYIVDAREKELKDRNSAIYNAEERGKKIGEEKAIKETAKEMKKKGLSVELIMDITKLSKEEIEEL